MRNRTALITGGASGIGRAIGEAMARRGARVVLADRQVELAREVAERIVAAGGDAWACELDVRDADAFAEVARSTRERTGSVDTAVGASGIVENRVIDNVTPVIEVLHPRPGQNGQTSVRIVGPQGAHGAERHHRIANPARCVD